MKSVIRFGMILGLSCVTLPVFASFKEVSSAQKRLDVVRAVFNEKGSGAAQILNGLDSGSAKSNDNPEILGYGLGELGGGSPVICINAKNEYFVHTGNPSLLGKSAISGESSWRDSSGQSLVENVRKALAASSQDPGKTTIPLSSKISLPQGASGTTEFTETDLLLVEDHRKISGIAEGCFCATEIDMEGMITASPSKS